MSSAERRATQLQATRLLWQSLHSSFQGGLEIPGSNGSGRQRI